MLLFRRDIGLDACLLSTGTKLFFCHHQSQIHCPVQTLRTLAGIFRPPLHAECSTRLLSPHCRVWRLRRRAKPWYRYRLVLLGPEVMRLNNCIPTGLRTVHRGFVVSIDFPPVLQAHKSNHNQTQRKHGQNYRCVDSSRPHQRHSLWLILIQDTSDFKHSTPDLAYSTFPVGQPYPTHSHARP